MAPPRLIDLIYPTNPNFREILPAFNNHPLHNSNIQLFYYLTISLDF